MITTEQVFTFTLASAGVYQVPWQNNCAIRRAICVAMQDGDYNLTLYNRAFSYVAKNLVSITASDGKCLVKFAEPHLLLEGDPVTIAGTTTYDGAQRVESVVDPLTVLLTASHSVDKSAGTAALAITSNEQALYRVAPAATASSRVAAFYEPSGYPFVNMDPQPQNTRRAHQLYVYVSAAGTYRLSLTGTADQT